MSKSKGLDYNLPFIKQINAFLNHLFSDEVLPTLILLSLFYILFPLNIIFFLLFNLIATMMAYKVGFDLCFGCSKGKKRPGLNFNDKVSNSIYIKVVAVAFIFWVLKVYFKDDLGDDRSTLIFTLLSYVLTPVIYMFLAMTNSLVSSLNPINWLKVILGIPSAYFMFVGFTIFTNYLVNFCVYILESFPIIINGILSLFIEFTVVILNFYILGFILFQNKEKLNFYQAEIKMKDYIGYENPIYNRIKKLIIDGELSQAREIIMELKHDGDDSLQLIQIEYNLNKTAKQFEDSYLSSEAQIHNLLNQGKIQTGFSHALKLLESKKTYLAYKSNDYIQLITYAKNHNKNNVALKFVDEFHKYHSKHNSIVTIDFLKAQIMYEQKQPISHIKGILKALLKNHPEHPESNEIKSWLVGLEIK